VSVVKISPKSLEKAGHGGVLLWRPTNPAPVERLKYSLNVPEVYLIWLKPELERLIVPNKFYGITDIGRSPISMTASDGEIARLVRQHSCGPDRASKQRSAGADPGLQRSACGAEM
jgi:hypothetical protein